MKSISHYATFAAATVLAGATAAFAQQVTGPSSSQSPYLEPYTNNGKVSFTSILSVGDTPDNDPNYRFAGIPDGLGAFDNNDGTFTVLVNHELRPTVGVRRDHNQGLPAVDAATGLPTAGGAFVSKYTVRKSDFRVLAGDDLIKTVNMFDVATNGYVATDVELFNRFCSADLPEPSAFAFSEGGVRYGTNERIFTNGEEATNGRAFAHVVSTGETFELPKLGKVAFENVVANPLQQRKTIVAGLDDSDNLTSLTPIGPDDDVRPSEVYFYVGEKQQQGTVIEQAGLTNGKLFGVKVDGTPAEDKLNGIGGGTKNFTLAELNDQTAVDELGLQNESIAKGVTQFLRVEDGQWDPTNPEDFYFTTTDQYEPEKDFLPQATDDEGNPETGRTRLWKLSFADLANPELGGEIEAVIDGSEFTQMLDNMTIDKDGLVILQEDVGNQPHNGKVWAYDPDTDNLVILAEHDKDRFGDFGLPATAPFSQDEESSGVIDISAIIGEDGWYLMDVQAHRSLPFDPALTQELVEGGQLLAMRVEGGVGVAAIPLPGAALMAPLAMGLAGVAHRRMRKGRNG